MMSRGSAPRHIVGQGSGRNLAKLVTGDSKSKLTVRDEDPGTFDGKWLDHHRPHGHLPGLLTWMRRRAGMRRKLRASVSSADAVTTVTTLEETESVPYYLQGNTDLHSEEMIDARLKLRHAPQVLEVLHVWWQTAQCSLRAHKSDENGAPRRMTDEGAYLSKERYMLMSTKLYRALVDEWDEADCLSTAEQEWEHDADGDDRMCQARFFDAIFECARPQGPHSTLTHCSE